MISAFAMYSRIPVPQIEWKEENRRYALCFLPLIGAVIGGLIWLWAYFCGCFELNEFVFGAGAMFIPLFITGGIHMDGFCDVSDALASYAPKEKALEIMSDSRVGAFGAMRAAAYLIIQTAFFSAAHTRALSAVCIGAVLSRALSGLIAVTAPCAKHEGTLQSFVKPAHKAVVIVTLSLTAAACIAAMVVLSELAGVFGAAGALLTVVYYLTVCIKRFGGITGDTAGWFLQLCELAVLIFAVIGEKIF